MFRVLSEEHVFDEMTPEEETESIERTLTRRRSSALGRAWSRRESDVAVGVGRWTPRMSVVSRVWTRRTNTRDVEAGW